MNRLQGNKRIYALRWQPGKGYEVSFCASPYDNPGRPITELLASYAPCTLGNERLDKTALRFPFTWCVVHPTTPWII